MCKSAISLGVRFSFHVDIAYKFQPDSIEYITQYFII